MDAEPSSPSDSRRSSRSHIVRLKLPPRSLALATSTTSISPSLPKPDPLTMSSPFPPSSPPTIASSPAPGAVPIKRRGGPGKRRGGPAPGSGVFSINNEVGPGSGTATPLPTTTGDTKERAKPGPKANPGGINEKLRALDRTGKPTRRWKKVQYPVNTCAGYVFYTTTWVAPVPGDSLYDKKKDGETGRREKDRPLEDVIVMGEAPLVVA